MDKINACVVSYFMGNIDPKTVEMQKSVCLKFNTSGYDHYYMQGDVRPAVFMDYVWAMNGFPPEHLKSMNIEKKIDYDVILFLDIDCIPLSPKAFDLYIEKAAAGRLVGNIQRSNHLENNQHVFAAPSAVALATDIYLTIGRPSALETNRSDVCEEWTFAAEQHKIPVDLYMPLKYDRKPTECDYWALKDGMPVYGQGTTFGSKEDGELFYHNFQIFHPNQQKLFWKKCEEVLGA